MLFFCLFQCFEETEYQTESKRNETFVNVIFSPNVIQETWTLRQGIGEAVMRVGGAPPRARPPTSWPPWKPSDANSNSIYLLSERKKSERRNYRVLRHGAAAKPYSLSGGLIWSPFGAPERGIRRLHHHQPSSITNFMMLNAVRE